MIVDPNPSPPPPEQSLSAADEVNDGGGGVGLIGDATSWPSLSESTRPSPKSSPAPSIVSDSTPPIAASQVPTISDSPQNHTQPNTNSQSNSNTIFSPHPNRQRFSGRGGSSRGGGSRGGFICHPPPPQQLPSPPPLPPVFYSGFEGPMRGPFFIGNGYGAHPRPLDHNFQQPRSPHRGGGRPRGDGGRHYNRVNYHGPEFNAIPQGYHPRDVRFPQPGPLPMGFHPMPHQQLVPFPFMHVLSPEPFMGMPPYSGGHGPVPPPSLSPPPPVELEMRLLNQINYYFSDENLIKDMYLRSQMDDGGWVSISLIANFNKVRKLTQDINLIMESLGASAVVEVQGEKIRRRNDWRRWITTSSEQ